MSGRPLVRVITSCTGKKAESHTRALTFVDFNQGPDHVAEKTQRLMLPQLPAQELYTGEQHVRLMRGIRAIEGRAQVDLHIVSAGYGLVHGRDLIAPYECTFTALTRAEIREWGERIRIPQDFRRVVSQPYDLGLILLSDTYLSACDLQDDLALGGPTLAFVGPAAARRLPRIENLRYVPLGQAEAKRFSCGLVGLKGEVARRLLSAIERNPAMTGERWLEIDDVLDAIENTQAHLPAGCACPDGTGPLAARTHPETVRGSRP